MPGSAETRFGPATQPEGSEQDRPAVADICGRKVAVSEQVGAGVVPELIASCVVEPAVVPDGQREREHWRATGRAIRPPRTYAGRIEQRCLAAPQVAHRNDELRGRRRRGRAHERAPAVAPACSRYQAIVRSSPSRSGVRASKPKSSGARRVEAAPRLAVRHRRVPHDLAFEAGELRDQLGELADRDLDARAEVHGLGAVVALGGEHEPFDAVVDVEELARRRAVAPEHDLAPALSSILRIRPGMTCDVSRSKLSRGP